jgi:hypothetical protein
MRTAPDGSRTRLRSRFATASRLSSWVNTGLSAWRLAGLDELCDLLDHPWNVKVRWLVLSPVAP